ncbi:MAG: biopolymer transporter ExbD [Phycisphaeraceae bacterium]
MERPLEADAGAVAAMAGGMGGPSETVHHQARRKGRDVQGGSMSLNLTSMIDVVFQLLIYFIITAAFVLGEGIITANLPTGTGVAAEPDPLNQPLYIDISSAGQTGFRIRVGDFTDAPSNFSGLTQMLTKYRVPNGPYPVDKPIVIRPEGAVRWQHVVNGFNSAVSAKYSNVAFGTAQ